MTNECTPLKGTETEAEMRDAPKPRPQTQDDLHTYIDSLTERQHDYGTCVYAMSLAAAAAFNYVAHKLGVTGFQASCAELDFLKRSRGMTGPFMIVDGNEMLYPQYDSLGKVRQTIEEWLPWAGSEAVKKLAEVPDGFTHPDVRAHWEALAKHAKKE